MKNIRYKKTSLIFTLLFVFAALLPGCGQQGSENLLDSENQLENLQENPSTPSTSNLPDGSANSETTHEENEDGGTTVEISPNSSTLPTQDLAVHFGDDGAAFLMHLYDNDTAAAIAKHVGTADWRLPIDHYDDYENYEVMQYYDIPERYEIPFNPETVTSEKAGEVYYSHPNRIVLFYGDAEVTGEYTKIGYFDTTDEFQSAVRDNPVLEGWGNKIVLINSTN